MGAPPSHPPSRTLQGYPWRMTLSKLSGPNAEAVNKKILKDGAAEKTPTPPTPQPTMHSDHMTEPVIPGFVTVCLSPTPGKERGTQGRPHPLGPRGRSPASHSRLAFSSRTRQLRKSSKPSCSPSSAYRRTTSCRR